MNTLIHIESKANGSVVRLGDGQLIGEVEFTAEQLDIESASYTFTQTITQEFTIKTWEVR